MYVYVYVYVYITKCITLKNQFSHSNKKLLALKSIEDIKNFFQTAKSGSSYLNVLTISRHKLSSKGPACALKMSIIEFSTSCEILYALHFVTLIIQIEMNNNLQFYIL